MPDVLSATSARISKLDLHEGDTLVVQVPYVLGVEARLLYVEVMRKSLPPGVKCLVLDGGVTLQKLKREHEAEIDSEAYRAAFLPKVSEPVNLSWWERVRNWVKAL